MQSLADLDTSKLTPEARSALSVTQRVENDGEDLAKVLSELGIDEAEHSRRVQQLAHEWRAQSGRTELPALTTDEYVALRESIRQNGQIYPILRAPDHDDWIVDGENRERACLEIGIEPTYKAVYGSRDELESLALVVNLARRQLTAGARRGIVKSELLRDPERSDRAIAATVGVSHPTVAKVRRELEHQDQLERVSSSRGLDGKTRPKPTPQPSRAGNELPDGVVDVTLRIAKEVAAQLDAGAWMSCKAVRLVLAEPGVYSLEVQT